MSQLTKIALVNSLKKLLSEKPLSRITISDITDECGVNRMTFYYHFRDIYDLIEWSCAEDAAKILRDINLCTDWKQGMIQILQEIKNNRIFIMNMYRCISRDEVEKYLHTLLDPLVKEYIQGFPEGSVIPEEDRAFVTRIYSYCIIGLILDWVNNDMREEPRKLVDRFSLAIDGCVHVSLENFRKS